MARMHDAFIPRADGRQHPSCEEVAALGLAVSEPEAPQPAVVDARPVEVVPQIEVDALRTHGAGFAMPPDAVTAEMIAHEQRELIAVVKTCVNREGFVSQLRPVKPSSYREWDAALFRTMRGWRFRPFQRDGQPVAVCTAFTFVYRLE